MEIFDAALLQGKSVDWGGGGSILKKYWKCSFCF